MIWDIDEREECIKAIKDFLDSKEQKDGTAHLFKKTEYNDKIIKEKLEQEKKDLLDRIIKDKDGNWIGIINTNFMPDTVLMGEDDNTNSEENEPMEKYKWFNKMQDAKKDYSKMSQEELKAEARKIEVIDDDGSTVTIGELIERDKQKAQLQNNPQNSIPQKDSKSNNNDNNDNSIDDIDFNIKDYSDRYSNEI